MAYKRILTIQDISCVGQCSMTVAFPILSACGHEICMLPTAILSTHTGGFGKPAVIRYDDQLAAILDHWNQNDIRFDAVLVGYLGSEGAVDMVNTVLDEFLTPDGIAIVDPAMADHGKLYSGLTQEYAQKMALLCARADIILPNLTELALFTGMPGQQSPEEVQAMLQKLNHPCVVLTGVGGREGETGFTLQEKHAVRSYSRPSLGGSYHGTGDMFAACFTGALMQGKSRFDAAVIAAEFVAKAIGCTLENPAHWYGVKFEKVLPDLIRMLES